MNNNQWEDWLTQRKGTFWGDESRRFTPKQPKIKTPKIPKPSKELDLKNGTGAYSNVTNEMDGHTRFENLLAVIISLGFFILMTYAWVQSKNEIQTKWYWYFGFSALISFGINWLLQNPLRIILSIIRNLIKLAVILSAVAFIGWIIYLIVNK